MNLDEKKINKVLIALAVVVLCVFSVLAVTQSPAYKSSGATISERFTGTTETQKAVQQEQSFLDYSHRAEKIKTTGVFGNEIARYYVHVKNKDYVGGYFTVKFYFTDKYSRISTETITKYIAPQEEESFFYQNIHEDKYKYSKWEYAVISQTKQP
ncbi:MAG: hypothetical protein ABH804_01470 [archaeon]